MGRTFQHVRLLPTMSVLENVAIGAHLRGAKRRAAAALHLERAEEARLLAEAAPARARRPGQPPLRRSRQPAARPAAHPGDRPRAGRRPLPAAPRRAGGRPALPGEAGPGRAPAQAARRGHGHPAGRARHGFRHGPGRPGRGDGVRREDRRRACPRKCSRIPSCWKPIWEGWSDEPPMLEIRDLCVSYGKVEALHHINLKVEAGQIVTVIGPNGAGKTTCSRPSWACCPRRARSSSRAKCSARQ
jgi:ABC-type multidrug transport system fused ATPase/permease subunit